MKGIVRAVTADKHCQGTSTGAEKWRKEWWSLTKWVEDRGEGSKTAAHHPCRTRGAQALQTLVRGRGGRRQPPLKWGGPACGTWNSQFPSRRLAARVHLSWRVQSNASRAGGAASNTRVLVWCRLTANLPSDLTSLTFLNMKRKRSSDIWKKVSGMNKR